MNNSTVIDLEKVNILRTVKLDAPATWLSKGWDDFKAYPFVSMTYGLAFVLGGFFLFYGLDYLDLSFLILPLSGGFILFAPFLCIGLYEVSRQREAGLTPTFLTTFSVWKKRPNRYAIMAFVLLMFMMVWTEVAIVIYALMMGSASLALEDFVVGLISRTDGVAFLCIGSLIGLVFAATVFLYSAISIPMIVDLNVSVFYAMKTSKDIVLNNSHVMWSWAFSIGIITWFAVSAFFIGLIVAMPVLAYASWHAYRDLSKE